jgi:hypothetical protein
MRYLISIHGGFILMFIIIVAFSSLLKTAQWEWSAQTGGLVLRGKNFKKWAI